MENTVNKKHLMIIDTDAGGDDALAMLLALNHPDWEVLAITTVHGNVDIDRATSNVLRILNVADRTEVPVYMGSHYPILRFFKSNYYHGQDGLSDTAKEFPLPDGVEPKSEMAAVALINLVKKHPKQINLVALGPLTNLALAHRLDRTFAQNIKQLVIMGGNMEGKGNVTVCGEFNFMCDAEAADITIKEFPCPKTIVTWDVCIKHAMPWEWYQSWTMKSTKLSHFVQRITSTSFANRLMFNHPKYRCCDLLAMTATLYPQILLNSVKKHVRVELQAEHVRGLMVIDWRSWSQQTPNADVHVEYDIDAIKEIWEKLTD